MRTFKLLLLLGAALLSASWLHTRTNSRLGAGHHATLTTGVSKQIVGKFHRWATTHGKVYGTPEEQEYRFKKFYATFLEVEAHNTQPDATFRKGLTFYADMDDEEFGALIGSAKETSVKRPLKASQQSADHHHRLQGMAVPESVDWKFSKIVGPVRDIGTCGGCYAIAAVEAVEVAYFQETGNYVQFSAQEILECSNIAPFNNNGCNGGSIIDSFLYVQRKGISAETAYPYSGKLQKCQSEVPRKIPQEKMDFLEIPAGDSDSLKAHVARRPISTKMNFDGLRNYVSGIYNGEKCASIATHYVNIVGYDTEVINGKKVDYWIIKNNVGTSFGENGYLRVVRAQGPNPSVCGITEYAIYPYFAQHLHKP